MTTNQFWSQNPANKREQIMQHSLPQLLFRQCSANCLDTDMFSAEKAGEVACMQNCQDKTYQAFDMFMKIKSKQAALKQDFIDHYSYSGMEPERSSATIYLPSKVGTHVETYKIDQFTKSNANQNLEVRSQALVPEK